MRVRYVSERGGRYLTRIGREAHSGNGRGDARDMGRWQNAHGNQVFARFIRIARSAPGWSMRAGKLLADVRNLWRPCPVPGSPAGVPGPRDLAPSIGALCLRRRLTSRLAALRLAVRHDFR